MKFCDNFVRGPMIFFVPCEQIYRMQFLLGTFSVGFFFFFYPETNMATASEPA